MNIHFIGIGGIGVSALAQYYLSKKEIVTGSDVSQSEITDNLKNLGASVFIGSKHKASNLSSKTNLVIYSPAIKSNNPEIKKAKKLNIKIKSYPKALGDITKKHFTIAVSGTHGKSTTSAIISLLLIKSNFDPTIIIGTKLRELNYSNFRKGKSKYLVIEADEYKKSFLNYRPQIAVLTNIEEDHLDYYKNINDIINAFKKYIENINKNGYLIANKDDKNTLKLLSSLKSKNYNELKIKKYSLKQPESKKIKKILKVPGEHNIYNSLAAMKCAKILKIKEKDILKNLSLYKGSWRRFETHKTKNNIIVSDYAHHPTEVEKTLKAARDKYPLKKIRCIFQPHQYLRTFHFFNDFIKAIKEAPVDEMILCEVYDVPGRENKKIPPKSTSKEIKENINKENITYKKTLLQAFDYIKKTSKKNEVLIVMGAGDIYNLFLKIKNYYDKK